MPAPDHAQRSEFVVRAALGVLAFAGLGLSAYLIWAAFVAKSLPLGCGGGSGCATVLTSRWAGVGDVPVSVPAALAYLAALGVLPWTGAGTELRCRALACWTLLAVGAATLTAAAWFIVVQLFVIHAICPWCMAGHAVGAIFGVVAILFVARRSFSPIAALLGIMLVGGLIAGTVVYPYRPPDAIIRAAGDFSDTGAASGRNGARRIRAFDGALELAVADRGDAPPLIGEPDAEQVIVLLFDYCCPHCRATHAMLLQAIEDHPGRIAVVSLPLPMDADCNPHVTETEARFEHSCELTELALAVQRVSPRSWRLFDRWLFEPEEPRDPVEARAEAERLVGREPLAQALEQFREEGDRSLIARVVALYGIQQFERLPVMTNPRLGTIVGRPADETEFVSFLRERLGLVAP